MARDVLITPASGLIDFLDTSVSKATLTLGTNGILVLTGGSNPIVIETSTSGSSALRVDGTNGTLFEVVDDLSGSLMSVNDAAGLPVLEVFADSHIVAGRYGQNDFYLDTNGNLGLGTASPIYKLQVDNPSGSTYGASFRNTNDNLQLKIGTTTGGVLNIQGTVISTGAAYKIGLQADGGDVGIGTANPTYKLHVVGNSYIDATSANPTLLLGRYTGQPTIQAGSDDGGYLIMDSCGGANAGVAALNWYSSDNVVLALGGGNVGIGTNTTGNYKLLVNGTCSYLGTYADVSATSGAFRFYDGTTFRGGLGTDCWGHGASVSDIALYIQGDNDFFISTNGTKRFCLHSSGACFYNISALCTSGNIIAGSCLAVAGGNSGYLRDITGQYGSIEVTGGATGGWEGYSIGGRMVFMHNGDTATGIYNDVDNEWLFYGLRNSYTAMYYNGAQKICAVNSGGEIVGNLNLCTSNPTLCWGGNRLYMHTNGSSTIGVVTICKNPNGTAYSPRFEISDSSDATRVQLDSGSGGTSFVCGAFCADTLCSTGLAVGGSAVFGSSSIDPDSYVSYAGGFGAISDGSGWNARGLFVHSGITGGAAAIAHGGSCLYFGIQNGSAANSMATWMSVATNCGKTIWGTTTICGTTNICNNHLYICNSCGLWVKGGYIALENSSANDSLYICNDGASGASRLNVGGTLWVEEGGNVGIGTNNPGNCKLYVNGDALANGWLRTCGSTGLYNNTYGGGWFMQDSTYIRSYNDKHVLTSGNMYASQFVDANNNSCVVDPHLTSRICDLCYNGQLYFHGSGGGTAIDTATYDGYVSMRVIRNANGSSPYNDGMYIGYDNNNSGRTRLYGGGTANHSYICSDGCLYHDDGSKYWNAGNDGSGSGLDADTVDGIDSSSFVRSDTADTLSGQQYTFNSTSTNVKLYMTGHAGAAYYNYFLNASNDGGVKAVHFVNGSTRTADGGPNSYTIRNDGGPFILGISTYPTCLCGSALTYNGNTVWHAGNATIPTNNNQLTNGAGYTTCTGTTTASNSQTFTNKCGNISQWTNDVGYVTSSGGSMSYWYWGYSGSCHTMFNGYSALLAAGSNISLSRSGNTVTINASGGTDTNNYVCAASFSTSTGVLTLERSGGLSSVTTCLDGRYCSNNQLQSLWFNYGGCVLNLGNSAGVCFHTVAFSAGSGISLSSSWNGAYSSSLTITNTCASDYRLKSNIECYDTGYDVVKSVNTYKYDLNYENKKSYETGMIAHELQCGGMFHGITGIKDEVDEENNPIYQCVSYSALVPTLWSALRKSIDKIERLENKVAELENRVNILGQCVTE